MGFTTIGVVAGLIAGFVTGGRLHHVGERTFRWWGLLPVGLVCQVVAERFDVPGGFALVVVSYAALMAFAAANLRHVGMGVALIGLSLNALVILVNAGMPVRAEAIVAAEIADWDELETLDYGAKRHLEEKDDRLTFLGDIVPVPLLGEVLSFGDLILMVGVADVVAWLLHPARRREGGEAEDGDEVVDLVPPERAASR
jgi:hypothetical protein